jgi:hypothetical protein
MIRFINNCIARTADFLRSTKNYYMEMTFSNQNRDRGSQGLSRDNGIVNGARRSPGARSSCRPHILCWRLVFSILIILVHTNAYRFFNFSSIVIMSQNGLPPAAKKPEQKIFRSVIISDTTY